MEPCGERLEEATVRCGNDREYVELWLVVKFVSHRSVATGVSSRANAPLSLRMVNAHHEKAFNSGRQITSVLSERPFKLADQKTERGKILNPKYSIDRDQPTSQASPLRINTLLSRVVNSNSKRNF